MRKNFNARFLLILLLLFPVAIFSQSYLIKGNISTSKEPVSNAKIIFINAKDTSKKFSTLSDTLGNYQLDIITSVREEEISIPTKFELAQNYPNPFSNETAITYKLNKPLDVKIKIYDILGQEVKSFSIGGQEVGVHGIKWDGRDNFGNKVAAGIYFYQLYSGTETQVKKMVIGTKSTNANSTISDSFVYGSETLNKAATTKTETLVFTVQVTNTETTSPRIIEKEFLRVIVRQDTIINLNVQQANVEVWRFLGLGNETVTTIAVDPINTNIIYAGTLYDFSAGINGKLFKSTDYGETWDTLLIGGGYSTILIDPSNHNVIYATPGGIIKSKDGGKTWQPVINGIRLDWETRVQSLAINPKNPNVLYAGTGGFFGGTMYKSYDGGLHWNEIGADSLRDGVISIAIDPIDINNVYAGTAGRGILWKSTDAGKSWFRTGLEETGQLIKDIFVDTAIPFLTIYVGVSGLGIFKSEDGGMDWENINQGLPANSSVMKIQKSNSFRLFLIGSSRNGSGIYEYLYQKNEWNKIGVEMLSGPYYYYSDLKVSSNPDRLYFGGKGIYVMDLKE